MVNLQTSIKSGDIVAIDDGGWVKFNDKGEVQKTHYCHYQRRFVSLCFHSLMTITMLNDGTTGCEMFSLLDNFLFLYLESS
jgi:hypothetical protein